MWWQLILKHIGLGISICRRNGVFGWLKCGWKTAALKLCIGQCHSSEYKMLERISGTWELPTQPKKHKQNS